MRKKRHAASVTPVTPDASPGTSGETTEEEQLGTDGEIWDVIDQAILTNQMLQPTVDMRTRVVGHSITAPTARTRKEVIPDTQWARLIQDNTFWEPYGDSQLSKLQQGAAFRQRPMEDEDEMVRQELSSTTTTHNSEDVHKRSKITQPRHTSITAAAAQQIPKGNYRRVVRAREESGKRDQVLSRKRQSSAARSQFAPIPPSESQASLLASSSSSHVCSSASDSSQTPSISSESDDDESSEASDTASTTSTISTQTSAVSEANVFKEAVYPSREKAATKTITRLPDRLIAERSEMVSSRALVFGGRMFEHMTVTKEMLRIPVILETWRRVRPQLELIASFPELSREHGIGTMISKMQRSFTQVLHFIGNCGMLLGHIQVGELKLGDPRTSITCVLGKRQATYIHYIVEQINQWLKQTASDKTTTQQTVLNKMDRAEKLRGNTKDLETKYDSSSDGSSIASDYDDDDDDDEDGYGNLKDLATSGKSKAQTSKAKHRPGKTSPKPTKVRAAHEVTTNQSRGYPRIIVITTKYSDKPESEMVQTYIDEKDRFSQLEAHPDWVYSFVSDLLCLRMVYLVVDDIDLATLTKHLQTENPSLFDPLINKWYLHRSHADLQAINVILIDAQYYFFADRYW